jgi:hypothetical protein
LNAAATRYNPETTEELRTDNRAKPPVFLLYTPGIAIQNLSGTIDMAFMYKNLSHLQFFAVGIYK